MTSQYVWIAIIFGVFAAGLGMGYVVVQQSSHLNYMILNPQQMQQMMSDPTQMNQWQQTLMNNPGAMNQWMQNPQHVMQMTDLMRNNHDFTQQMMMEMINDHNIRLQMLGHLSENQEAMQQMKQLVEGGMIQNEMMGNMTGVMDNMMNP